MAKKLKKLLAVTLALSMTMSLLNLTAFAKGSEEKSVQVGEDILLTSANSDGTTRQDIDTLPSNTDPIWSVEDDSIASLTDNEDGTATLTGEAAGQAVATRVTYVYKWVGEEEDGASLSYYDLDDADPDTMTPVEVTTTWNVSVSNPAGGAVPEDADLYVSEDGSDETGDGTASQPYATILGAIANAESGDVIAISGRVLWGGEDNTQWPAGNVTITGSEDASVIMNGANGQDPDPNVTHLGCGVTFRDVTLEESAGVNYIYACGNRLEFDGVNFEYRGSVQSGEISGAYWSLIGGSDLEDVASTNLVIGENNADIVSVVGGGVNHHVLGSVNVKITADHSIYRVYGGGVQGDVGGSVTLTANNAGEVVGGSFRGNVGSTDVTVNGKVYPYSVYGGCRMGHVDGNTSVTIASAGNVESVYGGCSTDNSVPWDGNWRGEFDLTNNGVTVADTYVDGDTYVTVDGISEQAVFGGSGTAVHRDTHVTINGTVYGGLNCEGVFGGGSSTGGDVLGSSYVIIGANASIPMVKSAFNGSENLLGGAVFGGGRSSIVHSDTHVTINGRVGSESYGGLVLGGGYGGSSDVGGTAYVTINAAPYAYTSETKLGWQQYGKYDFLCGLSGVFGGGFNNPGKQDAVININTDMGETPVYGDGLCGYLNRTTVNINKGGAVSTVFGYKDEEGSNVSAEYAEVIFTDGNASSAKQVINADLVQVTNGSCTTIDNAGLDNEQLVNVSNLTIDKAGELTLGASAHILGNYSGSAEEIGQLTIPAGKSLTADGTVTALTNISIVDAADGTAPAEAQVYVISGAGSTTDDGDFTWIDRRNGVKMEWKDLDGSPSQWWLVKAPGTNVVYHANNGDDSLTYDGGTYTENETVTVLDNDTTGFALSGYHFIGWNTMADGTGTGYGAKDTFPMPYGADVHLYAIWEKDSGPTYYTVTVDVSWYDTTTKGSGSQPSGQPLESLVDLVGTYTPGTPIELDFTAYRDKYPDKSIHSLSAGDVAYQILYTSPTSAGYSNGVSFTMPSKDVIVYLRYCDKGTTFNEVGLYETVSGDYSDIRYTAPDYNNWSAEDLFLKQHGTAVEITPRTAEAGFRWYTTNAYTYHLNTAAMAAFPLNVADAGMGALTDVTYDAATGRITGISRPLNGDYAFYLYHYYQMLRPVSYRANGGDGSMETQSYVKGDAVLLAENGFTRSGYTFTGWNTASDGSGTAYQPGDTFTMGAVEGVTLYAQWTEGSGSIPVYYNATVNYLDKATGNQITTSYVSNAIESGTSYDISAQKLDSILINGVTYAFDSQDGDALSGTMDGDKVINLYYVVTETDDGGDDGDDDDTPPVVIPDNPPPTTEQPPVVDIPTEEVPKSDLPAVDLPNEEVPLADVPATGDASLLWLLAAVLSGSGLAWLTLCEKKRRETEI